MALDCLFENMQEQKIIGISAVQSYSQSNSIGGISVIKDIIEKSKKKCLVKAINIDRIISFFERLL